MLKKFFLPLLFLTNNSLSAATVPPVVNYAVYPSIERGDHVKDFNLEAWKLGGYAYNCAPELTSFFAFLKQNYQIDTVVETGTLYGGTCVNFACLFNSVHTIEINQANYNFAKGLLGGHANVQCHFGNSPHVLETLLPTLQNKRILFYLDAHWESYWPLLDELEVISRTHKNQCIIVIDDFKVPGRNDIPYDYYGNNECSYLYVKNHIDKIFTGYTSHYLLPKSVHSRAKFVVIPRIWSK